jgi:hypothetical protein
MEITDQTLKATSQKIYFNGVWHTPQEYEQYINSKEMSLARLASASERLAIAAVLNGIFFEKMAEAAGRIANAFEKPSEKND